jgi:hypothetical protein
VLGPFIVLGVIIAYYVTRRNPQKDKYIPLQTYLNLNSKRTEMSRNILYTKHAEDMVKLRKISKGLVDKALVDPDEIVNQNETKIS